MRKLCLATLMVAHVLACGGENSGPAPAREVTSVIQPFSVDDLVSGGVVQIDVTTARTLVLTWHGLFVVDRLVKPESVRRIYSCEATCAFDHMVVDGDVVTLVRSTNTAGALVTFNLSTETVDAERALSSAVYSYDQGAVFERPSGLYYSGTSGALPDQEWRLRRIDVAQGTDAVVAEAHHLQSGVVANATSFFYISDDHTLFRYDHAALSGTHTEAPTLTGTRLLGVTDDRLLVLMSDSGEGVVVYAYTLDLGGHVEVQGLAGATVLSAVPNTNYLTALRDGMPVIFRVTQDGAATAVATLGEDFLARRGSPLWSLAIADGGDLLVPVVDQLATVAVVRVPVE